MAAPRKHQVEDSQFSAIVAQSLSIAQVIGKMGLVPAGGNYKTVQARIVRLGIDTGHFTGKGWNTGKRFRPFARHVQIEDALTIDSTYTSSNRLKKRLLSAGYKNHLRERCGLDEWLGQPIALELHHLNGINNDHRIQNLQLLCPNCHAQTASYRGKNQKRARVV